MKKLNLGCGENLIKGYVNVDYYNNKADVIHDLNKFPYPFKDNEFDEVFISHVLEHLDDIKKVLKEIRRITKNNGILHIKVPHSAHYSAYCLTHKTFWTSFSFPREGQNDSQMIDLWDGWELLSKELIFTFSWRSPHWNKFFWIFNTYYGQWIYENSFFRYLIPAREIYVKLRKIAKRNILNIAKESKEDKKGKK